MVLLLRMLPYLLPWIGGLLFYEQLSHPLRYPWILLPWFFLLVVSAFAIAYHRIRTSDLLEKMAPLFVLHAVLMFAVLLAEGSTAAWMIIFVVVSSSFMSLELLFMLAYQPSRYPVSGLSRVSIAYVPIATWYAASTSVGLILFLHTPRIWHVLLMMVIGMLLFRTTGHPGATPSQNHRWMLLGAAIGLHVGLLGLFLPLSLPMQGIVAAVMLSAGLRVRRYLYHPRPRVRVAWIEGVSAFVLFAGVLATAKWL